MIEKIIEGKPQYEPNPIAENQKYLKETYIEKIQGKKKEWIDRRVLNKVGLYMHGKSVYPTFNEAEHVLDHDKPPINGFPIIVGLDGGRYPAATFLQQQHGMWVALSEISEDGISAKLFAPKVKNHMAQRYPGFEFVFWGDPRMLDHNQTVEITSGDIFGALGMQILPATSDNDVETRRSTVENVLERRNGFKVNQSCLMIKRGLAGGYHYRKIKGTAGLFSPQPVKNAYSHTIEALEKRLNWRRRKRQADRQYRP